MTVRTRLALLFAAAVTMLVIATCSITYVVVRSSLRSTARGDAVTLARTAASLEDIHELSLDRIAGPGARVWLTNGSGAVVAQNHAAGPRTARLSDVNRAIANAPGGSTAARAPRRHGGSAIVLLANPTIDSSLSTLLSTLIAVGLAMVAASALAGALLARRVLEPVDRMRRQVDAIPGDELDRRIGEGRPDELGRLAAAFNRLLARAQRATEEQQRFIADASHELRTPVTALQGHARIVDRAAQRGDLEQARESALIVAQTSARLARTLSELLTLAAGAGGAGEPLRPQRLDRIAAEACAELHAAHPGRRVDAQLREATVDGEPRRLGELVRILLDNAIKYSPAEQPVSISVADSPDGARLEVRDHGAGFSDEDRAHAFDRFYRGSASRGVGGSGLGLAIAGSVAEQHHADIRLEDAPGGGTAAVVHFPPA
jgi:signal transduction histidine kinase